MISECNDMWCGCVAHVLHGVRVSKERTANHYTKKISCLITMNQLRSVMSTTNVRSYASDLWYSQLLIIEMKSTVIGNHYY